MLRTTGRLTALKVEKAKRPGMYADGGGLYLQVTDGGASWIYRYMLAGRAREMGLGPLALFGLSEARAKALDARRLRHEGIDPIEARQAVRVQAQLDATKAITFGECAKAYIEAHRAGWRNRKHILQWGATLSVYAGPFIGELPVQAIDTGLVLKVLEPIWTKKPETAGRVRGRVEAILDWAKVRGYREGENPARWRGHLDKLLPKRQKLTRGHHAALPFADVPQFMARLRQRDAVAALALEFTILTAARTGEALGARWDEIDSKQGVWTVPATRMKSGRVHRVALSHQALAVLKKLDAIRTGEYVFPGQRSGKPLNSRAFLTLLGRMGRGDGFTVHGFRSSFRDWAAERTNFPSEVAEMALAHLIGTAVENSYRRTNLLEKRRQLMGAWAEFLGKAPVEHGQVVSLRTG